MFQKKKTSGVGYSLNKIFEGHGYMIEALNAFLEFGKRNGLETVLAHTLPNNYKSQNVLKRCGFGYSHKDKNFW